MQNKLDMRHHKALLSVTLLVLLIVGIVFGGYLANTSPNENILQIMNFGLLILLLALALIITSILIRTRDELHVMHEENRQHFHNVHERIKTVHNAVTKKK